MVKITINLRKPFQRAAYFSYSNHIDAVNKGIITKIERIDLVGRIICMPENTCVSISKI